MKSFTKIAAQGEITIIRLGDAKKLPAGYTPMQAERGRYIVGHSETGHHHCMDEGGVTVGVLDRPPEGMRILRAIVESATPLVHLREHDTHEPILLEPGEYEFRIGREFDPYEEIARRQAD